MDVLEKRPATQYKDEIKKILKQFQYEKIPLVLKGSSSLASQQYPGDYDLFCVIPKGDRDSTYDFFKELLDKVREQGDMWFLELKLQDTTGKKTRVYPGGDLKKKAWDTIWDKLDFVKIDVVSRVEGRFTEISVIYSFANEDVTKNDYKKLIEQDIKDLKREKADYKILKRRFSLAKIDKDRSELLRLSKIFNGELGKDYQLLSTLEAVRRVLEDYQDATTLQKAEIQIKDLHLPIEIKDVEGWLRTGLRQLHQKAKHL